jgi:hypothetical protein
MLNYFRVMERIVDTSFSPPNDSLDLSLEDEKNLYLNAQATRATRTSTSVLKWETLAWK